MPDKLFYVFDLKNTQEDYAQCLEFIEIMENLKPCMEKEERLGAIKSIASHIQVSGGAVSRGKLPKRYFEVPLLAKRGLQEQETKPLVKETKRLDPQRIRDTILDYPDSNYHLRVHLSYTSDGEIRDLMELRYLALLLQRLRHLINEKHADGSRISIFIIPASASRYPFKNQEGIVDTETYQVVSTYLRLISKTYTGTVYGVNSKTGSSMVQALDFKASPRFFHYFPLTPIKQETYEKLFHRLISKADFDLLFASRNRRKRFRNAANERPDVAFSDYLLEASADALKPVLVKLKKERQTEIMRLVRESLFREAPSGKKAISLLAFALFCFTFSSVPQNILEDSASATLTQSFQDGYRRALDLADGLRQVAQNTLQHSQTKSGIFTFSVQTEDGGQRVQLSLCDYNNQATFAKTFIRELERERDAAKETHSGSGLQSGIVSAYDGLILQGEHLQLKNFFMEYDGSDQLKTAWDTFRRADIYAHVGLLLFQAAVYRYKGSFFAANSASGYVDEDSSYFCNFGNGPKLREHFKSGRMIPGTQFFIEIPNTPMPPLGTQAVLGLAQFNHIHESYYDFARYIPFHFRYCTFSAVEKDVKASYSDAQDKLAAVQGWRNAWISSIREARNKESSEELTTIFVWDMDRQDTARFISSDASEVFWKGFVEALDILGLDEASHGKDFRYIAVINLTQEQTDVFRMLCQTYYFKSFPSHMQVYISQAPCMSCCEDSLNDVSLVSFHLLGDTYGQAMQNAYCLATERGTHSFDAYELEPIWVPQAAKGLVIPEKISVCPFDAIVPWRQAPKQEDGLEPKDWSLPTLFDHQIELMAASPIDKPPHGYKITDTHMQLGSKVHIFAFYEMAFLFYRTSIANRIAFEILRELNKDSGLNLLEDRFLFYGYASYSKALLTSIVEILKIYRTICKRNSQEDECHLKIDEDAVRTLAFAAYQHNLQSEPRLPKTGVEEQNTQKPVITEKTQLYFDFPKTDSGEAERIRDFFQAPVKLIQIVPISSTLTTFNKMYVRLCRGLSNAMPEGPLNMQLLANYTAFWVTDQPKDIDNSMLSDIEKDYITYDVENDTSSLIRYRAVRTKFHPLHENPRIHFLMMAAATWKTPLQCKKCYPENLIAEVPLVNVDQTSTVPTQQLRAKKSAFRLESGQEENNERLLQLSRCIWKGHILREKNHFNYYIDTQKFFAQVRYDVLDISNSRIQGDSCVGCKQVQNAVHLFERSATRLHAQYWFNEINRNAICTYDDAEGYEKIARHNPDWEHSERKALLAHIAQNVIFHENDFFEPGAIYDSILEILSRLLRIQNSYTSSTSFQYQSLIDAASKDAEPWQLVSDFFHLVSRPFFSYDFKCRLQIQTILILFAESLLNGVQYTRESLNELERSHESADNHKKFLFQKERAESTLEIYQALEKGLCSWSNKMGFLDRCLFPSLAELQSTYLIRKKTFSGIYRFIQNIIGDSPDSIRAFLEHYAANIHYLLDSGNDDTRSLWLEYLFTTGKEYPNLAEHTGTQTWQSLCQSVTGQQGDRTMEESSGIEEQSAHLLFSWFCDEIFLQNTRILYDGIEGHEPNHAPEDSYSVEHCKRFRTVDGFSKKICESEKELFRMLLKYGKESNEALDVKKKYEDILQKIQKIAKEKYHFSKIKIALLTYSEQDDGMCNCSQEYKIQQLDFAASGYTVPLKDSWMRYGIKSKLLDALNKHGTGEYSCPLLKYGYLINCKNESGGEGENPYILIYFDNPEKPINPSVTVSLGTSVGRETKRIVKVFLYFSAQTEGAEKRDKTDAASTRPDSLVLRLFLRDILMYRHHLMKIMENDFAGDTFAKYSHTSNERNILAHEKVNSHNISSDDRTSLDVLTQPKTAAHYEILDSSQVLRWLLLRNYTNGQIAKLFNRSFGKRDDDSLFDRGDSRSSLPRLYISGEKKLENKFDKPLKAFYQLGLDDDARFILLGQAVSIQYSGELSSAQFICNRDGYYYNTEYMKCVLIDSLFSAMKYFSDREGFLPRLDQCLKRMHVYRHQVLNQLLDKSQDSPQKQFGSVKEPCIVTLTREELKEDGSESNFDYLVITNQVNYRAHNLFDWKKTNDQINAHLDSPTDFFDGQMSLLAIKGYIEGLYSGYSNKSIGRVSFEYVSKDSLSGTELKFVSKLPILKKRGNHHEILLG